MPRDSLAVVFAFTAPPLMAALWQRIVARVTGYRRPDWQVCALWCIWAILIALVDLAAGLWVACIAGAASAVLAVLWWWWRRKRRRLLSLLTSKYRYIRDRMVRVMRERARPRPVFRPVPGGAS